MTNSALGVLAEAETKTQMVLTKQQKQELDEEVEINLSFSEFEKLYAAGKITREQMKTGMIHRRDKKMIEDHLRHEEQYGRQNNLGVTSSHDLRVEDDDLKVFDCGLKRVDSKRYNRDYVVVRDGSKASPQPVRRKSWVVQTSPTTSQGAELVRSTPAGQREDVHAEIARAEEQVRELPWLPWLLFIYYRTVIYSARGFIFILFLLVSPQSLPFKQLFLFSVSCDFKARSIQFLELVLSSLPQ